MKVEKFDCKKCLLLRFKSCRCKKIICRWGKMDKTKITWKCKIFRHQIHSEPHLLNKMKRRKENCYKYIHLKMEIKRKHKNKSLFQAQTFFRHQFRKAPLVRLFLNPMCVTVSTISKARKALEGFNNEFVTRMNGTLIMEEWSFVIIN